MCWTPEAGVVDEAQGRCGTPWLVSTCQNRCGEHDIKERRRSQRHGAAGRPAAHLCPNARGQQVDEGVERVHALCMAWRGTHTGTVYGVARHAHGHARAHVQPPWGQARTRERPSVDTQFLLFLSQTHNCAGLACDSVMVAAEVPCKGGGGGSGDPGRVSLDSTTCPPVYTCIHTHTSHHSEQPRPNQSTAGASIRTAPVQAPLCVCREPDPSHTTPCPNPTAAHKAVSSRVGPPAGTHRATRLAARSRSVRAAAAQASAHLRRRHGHRCRSDALLWAPRNDVHLLQCQLCLKE
jgi:hypothetical protein